MGADALAHVLRPLAEFFPASEYPDLLAGLHAPDDAAVWRRSDDEALIATADFFPPIVDDPETFGAIAAANAMSDVFAMGGEVLLALNIAAFPADLPGASVAAIIRGGAERVRAAGGVIAGGHTVLDDEPKYGLAVIGRAHPDRLLRKSGARPGDVLLLTKPIGTGLVTTALKAGTATPGEIAATVAAMRALNLAAGAAAVAAGAHAATDVTGFGLAGHAAEMAERSGVALHIEIDRVPLLPGAERLAATGVAPAGAGRNVAAFRTRVRLESARAHAGVVVHDPQTSGGLLVALGPTDVALFETTLRASGGQSWRIGVAAAGSGVTFV
jgi:selenide,water dikinase